MSRWCCIHCRTYLHLKERTAKRWPAVNNLQEGNLSFFNSLLTLLVVRGSDTLGITNIHIRIYHRMIQKSALCGSMYACNEVNNFPVPPQPSGQFFWTHRIMVILFPWAMKRMRITPFYGLYHWQRQLKEKKQCKANLNLKLIDYSSNFSSKAWYIYPSVLNGLFCHPKTTKPIPNKLNSCSCFSIYSIENKCKTCNVFVHQPHWIL